MSMEVKWSFPTNSGRHWPQPQSKKKKIKTKYLAAAEFASDRQEKGVD